MTRILWPGDLRRRPWWHKRRPWWRDYLDALERLNARRAS